MGDDIEGVVSSVQPEINATIVPIRCEGFRSKIMQTSYDAIWHAVLKYLVRPPRRKQEDLVNIASSLNTVWSERLEASRLLGKMGLRANLVPELATTEQLQYLSEAVVSAPTCPSFTDYLYKGLQQEHGVPYFRSPIPIGLTNTDNWLRKIAEYAGKEDIVEKVIQEEHKAIDPQIEELKKRLKGKKITAVDIGGQSRALGLPTICAELGIEVTGTVVWEHDSLLADDLEERYKECGDFDILVADIQSYEQSMLLKKLKPDLYTTCSFLGTVTKGDYVSVRHHSFRPDWTPFSPMLFYHGTLAYGNLLLRQITQPGLQRTVAKHTTQPFKEKLYSLPLPLRIPYVSPDDTEVARVSGEVVQE
jgi:nitrogenase molybdenum-iron protein alpha chain